MVRVAPATFAAVMLGDLGYTDVTEIEGGMEAWGDDDRALLLPDQARRERG